MDIRYNDGLINWNKNGKFSCTHWNFNKLCKKCEKWLSNNLESENKKIFGELK